MNNLLRNTQATLRSAAAIIAVVPALCLAAVQGFVVGKFSKNQAIPKFIYNTMRSIMGYKVEFNKSSAPIVKDKPVWFVANHMSVDDFIALGSSVDGTFAGKGDILKWPVAAQMARAVNYIGLRRHRDFNPQSRAKIIKNFNAGYNTIMFPEATTTPGDKVYLFRAPLLSILFGEKGVDKMGAEVSLERDVVVQPIAIRVKTMEGQDALNNDTLRSKYTCHLIKGDLKGAWARMKNRGVTLELTVLPALNPKDFADERALINAAALSVASMLSPGQTTFEKAEIPGQTKKPAPAAPAA